MTNTNELIKNGLNTAFIDASIESDPKYKPELLINDFDRGIKVLTTIDEELQNCDNFSISVAFITDAGVAPLLGTLKELEEKNIHGRILTTDYLLFSDPKALDKLAQFKNIDLKMYITNNNLNGFHTKGYIFKKDDIYSIIVGSSNFTDSALCKNKEWNTKIISLKNGEFAQYINKEFDNLFYSDYAISYSDFIDEYKERYNSTKRDWKNIRGQESNLVKEDLKPNSMQTAFIENLKQIVDRGESKALLISATGTGKTFASAFAMREFEYKRVLFVVHRSQLAIQTMKSYKRVFNKHKVDMGYVGFGNYQYENDYIFATVETLYRDNHLFSFSPDYFDCIILDEAHHTSGNMYKKLFNYFTPKLWLGMTATPDKRDDDIDGKNIYELFNYQIAYEIRLQQAMQQELLCPFHYFGISDLALIDDTQSSTKKLSNRDFNILTSDERVNRIIEQANFYGYSGNRVKGLIFCSRVEESKELSKKFNERGFRTLSLDGTTNEKEREIAFERLAIDEKTTELEPLDYIFSVNILNEGVDIVEVNQVIMLRPTQSPIVFIQQLGRGLRKAENKEYVVILDFIGNYTNNFMIPIALSGDRTYNSDTIRKYVISGTSSIPGMSTVHFDEISRQRIFKSIDEIKGINTIIKTAYTNLKNRLGRMPYLVDFYENGEVDPLLIIKQYKSYIEFLSKVEKDYDGKLTERDCLALEYLSKTILSGRRPYELEIISYLLRNKSVEKQTMQTILQEKYGDYYEQESFDNSIEVLESKFVSKQEEYDKYKEMQLFMDTSDKIQFTESALNRLNNDEFKKHLSDIVTVGLSKFYEGYTPNQDKKFILYEKYSRRDVSLLMNCGKDLSSVMYGMYRIQDDVFIYITYHKDEVSDDSLEYNEGKPDYADKFDNKEIFKWDSKIGNGVDSVYMENVKSAKRKHLLVKKSDAEQSFYYMGTFDIISIEAAKKKNNKGVLKDIAKVTMKMHNSVRDDIYKYLESDYKEE